MTHKVTINVELEQKIRRVAESIDLDSIVVYETIMLDTDRLNQKGSIWDKGRIKDSTLSEMRDFIEAGNGVPLIELHEERLPIGKVFAAELRKEEERTTLHGLFYVPKDSQTAANIELSILESVSVGIQAKKVLCSECGWDYRGEDADWMNLYERTCANGHTVGVDGVHVVAEGLEEFRELSLVMKGASQKAKILPKSKQVMGKKPDESYTSYPLAATSLIKAEALMLNAKNYRSEDNMAETKETKTAQSQEDPKNNEVKLATGGNDLMLELANSKADFIVLNREKEALATELGQARKELDEVKAKAEKLAELGKLEIELSAAKDYLKDEAKKALVASGQKDKEIPETVAELSEVIKSCGVILAKNFPVGGVSKTSDENITVPVITNLDAYRTRK